jgi:hypothetical protein
VVRGWKERTTPSADAAATLLRKKGSFVISFHEIGLICNRDFYDAPGFLRFLSVPGKTLGKCLYITYRYYLSPESSFPRP